MLTILLVFNEGIDMEIKEFIADLKKSNFSLAVEGDKLILKADKDLVGPEEIQAIKKNEFVTNYIRENKAEIIKYLSFLPENILSGNDSRNISSIYRLSSLQQGMLFHGLYNEGSGIYVEQFGCDIAGLNTAFLEESLNYLLQRHSILRSAFYYDQFSVPVQCVYREVKLPVADIDLRSMNDFQQAQAIKDFEKADREKGFDFKRPPLMRVSVFRLTEDVYHVLWSWHHILFDGWSLPILMEELLDTYESLAGGKEITKREEDRYEDYIRYVERTDKEQEKKYWEEYMKGVEHSTLLPFIDNVKERNKGIGTYKSITLQIDTANATRIEKYSQDLRVTVNTIMQGVWSYLLGVYTGQQHVAYGVIVSGRPDDLHDVERRVGLYINTLPLHSVLSYEEELSDWLQNIQAQQAASRHYQHTSLQDIQSWTGIKGDLFDSLLVFENYPISKLLSSKQWLLKVNNIQIHERTNYPLNIVISGAGEISIKFLYNADLISDVHIKKIHDHFEHVLMQLTSGKKDNWGHLQLLTEAEQKQLLFDFNSNKGDYPRDKTIVDLFEEQVSRNPQAIAVAFEDEQLTYQQLNEKVNQLSHYLISIGVRKEQLVPICLDRSIDLIIGLLGILKAGAAYVPIDPNYPEDRISYMIEDTRASIILSGSLFTSKFPEHSGEILLLDTDRELFDNQPLHNPQVHVEHKNLVNVIYTSGSTGKPKGVMIEHAGLMNLVEWHTKLYAVSGPSRATAMAGIGFDAFGWEIWPYLANGATLYIIDDDTRLSPAKLLSTIEEFGITHCFIATALVHEFVTITRNRKTSLQCLLTGGDKLNSIDIKGISYKLFNNYGPTENTVVTSCYEVHGHDNDRIPSIGRPILNTNIYILANDELLAPVGIPGEICISGAGLAREYLNSPDLTEIKFVQNPFTNDVSKRMYRSGDIGRWMPDGNIEYLGRIDEQVKIRGFRVELGEIEAVLQQNEFVSQSVVAARDDNAGNKRLIGYVVPVNQFNRENIVSHLKARLPEYMVPGIWVELASLPLNSNGKIDRKALPDPETSTLSESEYVAAGNELETKLVNIWQELLKIEKIGVHHNFFEIGGHSLHAMRLISAIRREIGTGIHIRDIFEFPTISQLALYINQRDKGFQKAVIETYVRPEDIPLSFGQERLWFIDRLEGSLQYHLPSVFRLKGMLDTEALASAIQNIVNRHEVLRTVIVEKEGQAYQYIKNINEWTLGVVEDTMLQENDLQLQMFIKKLIRTPFDLSKDHMLRAHLIRLDREEHVLVVVMHHIASDGWSFPIISREVAEFYNAALEGKTAQLPLLQIQYADYSIWQRSFLEVDKLNEALQYWRKKLDGVQPLQLPTDLPRPAVQSSRGSRVEFVPDKELGQRLQAMSQQQGVTLFMTLAAALNVLLNRYSGQQDITIGTPVANRNYQELENLVGFFVNTLTLRNNLGDNPSFTDVLHQVKK